MSGFLAGAVMITRLAPAARCLAAASRSVNRPVDSNTTSTPRSFHGSCAGSFTDSTLNSSPSTAIASCLATTVACRLPSTESYLRRCASVLALVRSFTATKSMSLSPSAARMMLRPMRPNPLIPTLTGIKSLRHKRFILQYAHPDVSALQRAHARGLHRRVAVLSLSGGALQEVHRQPAAASRIPADRLQCRRRGVDLDPRGLGRRSAHRARARRRPEGALPAAAAVSVDDDDRRTAGGAAQPVEHRRRVLFPVRLDLHRPPHAAHRPPARVHHDGDRDLA